MSEVFEMLWQAPTARLERCPVAGTLATESLFDEGDGGGTLGGGRTGYSC